MFFTVYYVILLLKVDIALVLVQYILSALKKKKCIGARLCAKRKKDSQKTNEPN